MRRFSACLVAMPPGFFCFARGRVFLRFADDVIRFVRLPNDVPPEAEQNGCEAAVLQYRRARWTGGREPARQRLARRQTKVDSAFKSVSAGKRWPASSKHLATAVVQVSKPKPKPKPKPMAMR